MGDGLQGGRVGGPPPLPDQAPILQLEELTSRKGHLPKGTLRAVGRTETRIQTLDLILVFFPRYWLVGEAQPHPLRIAHDFLSV